MNEQTNPPQGGPENGPAAAPENHSAAAPSAPSASASQPNEAQRVLAAYELQSKSMAIAYVLWAFLCIFGAHRFYVSRIGTAVVMLVMSLTLVLIPVSLVWAIVDLFLIPGYIREKNLELINRSG